MMLGMTGINHKNKFSRVLNNYGPREISKNGSAGRIN